MKLSKGLFFKLLGLLAIANLLTACTAGQSTSDGQQEPLRVEYTLWWGDYTILVAQELDSLKSMALQWNLFFTNCMLIYTQTLQRGLSTAVYSPSIARLI